jgi:hypothetical protein
VLLICDWLMTVLGQKRTAGAQNLLMAPGIELYRGLAIPGFARRGIPARKTLGERDQMRPRHVVLAVFGAVAIAFVFSTSVDAASLGKATSCSSSRSF